MQKLLYLISIFIIAISGTNAQSVESFDYPTGESLEGLAGGDNWGGTWTLLKGNEQTTIDSGGISSDGVGFNSGGTHLTTTHNAGDGGARMFRLLDNPVTDDGGTYYLSWFMENTYDDPGANGSVHQVIIVASAAYGAGGPGGQLIRIGKLFNTTELGIDGTNTAGGRATGSDTRNGAWYVAVIEMSGDAEPENLYVFIDPNPGQPLDLSTADVTTTCTLNDGFDAIGAKLEGPASVTGTLDEIRFGTSYEEVISTNLVPVAGSAAEDFNDYDVDSLLAGSGGFENGWSGPWRAKSGAPFVTLSEGGLENFELLKGTTGNRIDADFSEGGTPNLRFERPLAGSYPDDGSTYYVSFSTQSLITDLNNTVAFFMLVDTAAFAAGGPGGQLVQIGKPLNTDQIGVGFGATPNQFAMSSASSADAHFIVARIKMSGDMEADTVDLFIDPDLESEPGEPDTSYLSTRLNNGFNGLGFKVEGLAAGIVAHYDDYYAGTSYADVIPDDLFDIDSPVDAFAFDKFSYPAGEELTGQGEAEDGWAGPWEALTDPDSSAILAGGTLNNNLLAITSGQSAQLTSLNTNNRIQRLFDQPIDTLDGEFWFSMHMAIDGQVGNNVANLTFVDTSFGGPAFQQIFIGKQFNNANLFAAGFGQVGGATQTGFQFELGSARWLVGHFVRNEANSTWEMDLWVDHVPGIEPDPGSAQIQKKAYSTGIIHGVMLKAEGIAGAETVFLEADDLLLGSAYADVVPDDLTEVPPMPAGATEKFNDYTAGAGLDGQTGGSGFDAPWTLITGEDPVIEDEGLTSFFALKQTSGTRVTFNANARMERHLDGEYRDVGRTFWLSYMFDTDNGGGNVAHIVLADTATYGPGGPGGQLAQIGKTFGGDAFGLVGAPGGTAAGVSTDTAHWIVVEIATNGALANDEIYIWVDPDPEMQPSRDTANIVGGADLTNWNALGFKVEGNPGVTAKWDDVLLGNTFSDVVPDDWTDVLPPEIAIPAVETFAYPAGEDLDAQDGGEGWGGPWTSVGGSATIDENSIVSDRVELDGNKVRVSQSGDPVIYDRAFFSRFGTNSDEIWLTFLLQVDQKSIGNTVQVSLANNGENVFSVGGVPGLENIGVVYNDGIIETSTSESVIGTNWFVMRINPDGDEADDVVRVWLNPVADALPDDGNALFTLTDVDLDEGFDALRLNASGIGTAEMFVDEFRIGFSFRDVSNKFGSSDPNLIAYEPFNYDPGQSLINLGGINAFWDGVWENVGNLAGNFTEITEGSAAFPEFEVVGNKVEFNYVEPTTQIRIERKLAFPIESDGSTYWLSWFQNTTTGDMLNNVANISLVNSATAQNGGQRLNIGRMFGNGKFGVISPPQNLVQNTDVDDMGLNWVVLKIETNEDGTIPDTVYMWINPPSDVEPDTSTAVRYNNSSRNFFALPFLKVGIDHIWLKTEGVNGDETPHIVEFDEFRISRTWESVVSIVTNTIEVDPEDDFQLTAYPNPFLDYLDIRFNLPSSERLSITVHDAQGRLVETLANDRLPKGDHTIQWNVGMRGRGLTNGIYYLRVAQGNAVAVRKLVLIR